MYELSIRKEAELDIEGQFRYYERVRVGLGHDYLLCIEEAIVKIQRHPLIYKKVYKNLRGFRFADIHIWFTFLALQGYLWVNVAQFDNGPTSRDDFLYKEFPSCSPEISSDSRQGTCPPSSPLSTLFIPRRIHFTRTTQPQKAWPAFLLAK